MSDPTSGVRNVSDTARWVAYFRALETRRPDALFRDPYAERLAGERGFQIANSLSQGNKHEWAWVARTYLFDSFLARELKAGADMVLNLAAGLDARPYRMDVSPALDWVEVDFPEIISYKEEILRNDRPRCRLERVSLDLFDVSGRRSFFASLNGRAKSIVVMSEGLLIYFAPADVSALARDLFDTPHFRSWIIDLASPGQLKLMQRSTGKQLSEANAGFQFGPAEGADFFKASGWEPKDVQGMLKTAAHFGRAPEELLSLLPEPKRIPPHFPWTGVCLLEKPR
jgi:methyltransferase (TIGR00027 family)